MNTNHLMKWPYPIKYKEQKSYSTDILVLGGGSAGLQAALSAAKRGARVIIVEKSNVKTSGDGGAGCDHWQHACTNPACRVSPEEMTRAVGEVHGGYFSGISRYIACKESFDTLLEMEKLGVKIRDTDNEFEGAEFRDEDTQFLYAYDYVNKYTIRWWGTKEKAALVKECKRLGVDIFNRTAVTGLLTENGKPGERVIGAMAIGTRTGEFRIFNAKAVIMALGVPTRLWTFSTEIKGFSGSSFHDPNCAGEGYDIGFRAGATYSMMEKTSPNAGPFSYPPYGTGNTGDTWRPCTIVDADGKEVPWVDRNGKILTSVSERNRPAEGQKFFLDGGGVMEASTFARIDAPSRLKYTAPNLISDLPQRIKNGEFKLPLYADLPSMPEHERRAIFGLMVGQEGKTKIPIYFNYTQAGFDPDKDMLECPVLSAPDDYGPMTYWFGVPAPAYRDVGFCVGGGAVIDWDLCTDLQGLYVAGSMMLGGAEHSIAATSGRHAGRKAAEYVMNKSLKNPNQRQIEDEVQRIYAPITRNKGISWKELNAGTAKIMQEYCAAETKSEKTLTEGLRWLSELRVRAEKQVFARNPHELMRVLECFSIMTVGEMTLLASLSRKASSAYLAFTRLDYREIDPPDWQKFTTIRKADDGFDFSELPLNYATLPPYAITFEENYENHCALKKE